MFSPGLIATFFVTQALVQELSVPCGARVALHDWLCPVCWGPAAPATAMAGLLTLPESWGSVGAVVSSVLGVCKIFSSVGAAAHAELAASGELPPSIIFH